MSIVEFLICLYVRNVYFFQLWLQSVNKNVLSVIKAKLLVNEINPVCACYSLRFFKINCLNVKANDVNLLEALICLTRFKAKKVPTHVVFGPTNIPRCDVCSTTAPWRQRCGRATQLIFKYYCS